MASAGQAALDPVQFSAASQRSTAARQTVLDALKASAGQVVLVPVQVSATSHTSAAARHTVPAFPAGCVHVALVPLQMSRVQTLPSSVHAVPFALKASVGHVVLVPVQVSATSHSPAAARHTVPAFPAACVHAGAPTVPLHTSLVHTLPSSVQLVPAAWTVSAGQLKLPGASAMSWPIRAVFPVDAFDPVAPAVACDASALSEAASVEPLEDSAWNRCVIPDGAPMAEPSLRPKQATSIVLAAVVVIDGVELPACPPEALMGLVVSTLKYALIPPATREDETVKV